MKEVIELTIKKYISEKAEEISILIREHHKVFIESNPATGKTTFFKEIAKTIVDKNLERRIIFVFPLLLIQDQLKESLNQNGYKIDLELNSESKRKFLKDNDRIITSTFQSLHHISATLTKEDIIIVDEAHSLFKSYFDPYKNERTFSVEPIIHLYFTKAKIVLMSGTPPEGIMKILDLKHIKLINDPPPLKAKISLLPSRGSKKIIAIEFAKMAVNKNGNDSLNIIYLKNIKQGVEIARYLNSINIKSKVLNSSEKKGSLYISISKRLIVPDDIQILITTNVISSGANIMNTNVGDSLMIDEYSPAEIKQFSKRFRNRLDIEVMVTNTPIKGLYPYMPEIINSKIFKQRRYLKRILSFVDNLKKSKLYDYDYSFAYDQSALGSPDYLIGIVLERYLKQETFYWENYFGFVEDSDKYLAEELNKYDDIAASYQQSLLTKTENIEFTDELDLEIKEITMDFIKYPAKYISTLLNYTDSYQRLRILKLLNGYTNTRVEINILENIKHPLFQKEILNPLLENVEYFDKNPSRCLYFIMTNSSRELTSYKISYTTSHFLSKHIIFVPSIESSGDYEAELSSEILETSLDKEAKNCITLIQIIVKYYFSNKAIVLSKMEEDLNHNSTVKTLLNFPEGYQRWPMKEIKKGDNGYTITSFFIKAFLSGIFYLSNKQSKVVNAESKKIKAFYFLDELPLFDTSITNKNYLDLYELAKNKSQIITSTTVRNQPTQKNSISFRTEETTKIIPSTELIQLSYLDKEFFDLL